MGQAVASCPVESADGVLGITADVRRRGPEDRQNGVIDIAALAHIGCI